MAQFTVYRTPDGILLLDCQSNALADLSTRLVVPLLPPDRAPSRQSRLNPILSIMGEPRVMVTQHMAAVGWAELHDIVADVADARYDIIGAIDMLLTGV